MPRRIGGKHSRPSITRMIAVSRATAVGGDASEERPQRGGDGDAGQPDHERDAGSSEEPAPQVAAELVGPQRMGELGGWALARGFSALGSAGARSGASAAADQQQADRRARDEELARPPPGRRGRGRPARSARAVGRLRSRGARPALGSSIADAGVQQDVAEVGEEVHRHEEGRSSRTTPWITG